MQQSSLAFKRYVIFQSQKEKKLINLKSDLPEAKNM